MNTFVTRIKKRITDFCKNAEQAHMQINENNQKYLPELAERQNESIWNDIAKQYENIRNALIDEFTEIREALSLASVPTSASVSGESIFFNEFPIIPTPQEFIIFSDLHENNFLWQRFLLEQLNKIDTNNTGVSPYADARFLINQRLPIVKLEAYAKIYQDAIAMIDSALDGSLIKAVLDEWLEENDDFYAELLNTIGDGSDIARYQQIKLPESAKHLYDSKTLFERNGIEVNKSNAEQIAMTFKTKMKDEAKNRNVAYA